MSQFIMYGVRDKNTGLFLHIIVTDFMRPMMVWDQNPYLEGYQYKARAMLESISDWDRRGDPEVIRVEVEIP